MKLKSLLLFGLLILFVVNHSNGSEESSESSESSSISSESNEDLNNADTQDETNLEKIPRQTEDENLETAEDTTQDVADKENQTGDVENEDDTPEDVTDEKNKIEDSNNQSDTEIEDKNTDNNEEDTPETDSEDDKPETVVKDEQSADENADAEVAVSIDEDSTTEENNTTNMNEDDNVVVANDVLTEDETKTDNVPEKEEIASDERFPEDQIPEQPKDIAVKKDIKGLGELKIAEGVPEVDIDPKLLEQQNQHEDGFENFKETSGGVAFDVNFDSNDEEKEPESSNSDDKAFEASSFKVEKKEKSNNDESEYKVYDNIDDNLMQDKLFLSVVDPEIIEASDIKNSEDAETADEDIDEILNIEPQRDVAYASEMDDDFNIDHKTGIMPSGTNILNLDDEEQNTDDHNDKDDDEDSDYEVMNKIREEVDAASKIKDGNTYIVTDELIDPIKNHHQFTIQRPSYREFKPEENSVIQSVQDTLKNERIKRQIFDYSINDKDTNQINPDKFPVPISFNDEVDESVDNRLQKIIDDLNKNHQFDQTFNNDDDNNMNNNDYNPVPIPGFGSSTKDKTLAEILGISEDNGPIMIEPEYNRVYPGSEFRDYDPLFDLIGIIPYEYDMYQPDKVIIETNQKMTILYDDNDGNDSNDKKLKDENNNNDDTLNSNKMDKNNDGNIIIKNSDVKFEGPKFQPIIEDLGLSQKESLDSNPEIIQKDEPVEVEKEDTDDNESNISIPSSKFEKTAQILSKNIVLTLSISPYMLLLVCGFVLILLIFKIYFIKSSKQSILPMKTDKINHQQKQSPVSVISTVKKTPLP